MKYLYKITLITVCVLLFSSCNKWLDVKPEDRFTEEQVFANANGFSDAINGVYLDLSNNDLYGAQLSMTTLEILAQRYNISSVHSMEVVTRYSYGESAMQSRLNTIWTKMYYNIANVNRFIENLDTYSHNIKPETAALFRGEAHGLRAFLHFELLRMFGPVYNSADSTALSIPYYQRVSRQIEEVLPANKVMNKIIADLDTAQMLLADHDPIIKEGIVTNKEQNYLNYRNYRMNFYAVKGIEARVHLWRNRKDKALAAAKVVIAAQTKFPWITHERIMNDKANPDRIFSTENLFMIETPQLYNNYNSYFSFNVKDDAILAPTDVQLLNVYENNIADYRFTPMWINTGTGKSYRTFFKYADVEFSTTTYRFAVPILRISELYYIAAECEEDPTTALNYLNTVLRQRSLNNLGSQANLSTELAKEYRKEFYGEGQLWYYYKRTKQTSIPGANGNKTMSLSAYVFPLPLSETEPR